MAETWNGVSAGWGGVVEGAVRECRCAWRWWRGVGVGVGERVCRRWVVREVVVVRRWGRGRGMVVVGWKCGG